MTIGYHASHEQFPPSELLQLVQLAEQAGFGAAMCSDHFAPWSEAQGNSGFAWSWLGAALQATSLSFGVVNAPVSRYHPAIIAQAAATLAEMYPGRFWIALGSGQLMNEGITGEWWPPKPERNARLAECVDIVRRLWAGETVTHNGRVAVVEARLWSLPEEPPMLVGAALTPETAKFVGEWADALITVNAGRDQMRRVIDTFRQGAQSDKPVFLQSHLSWAPSEAEAESMAFEQWRTATLPGVVAEEIRSPAHFEAAASNVRPADMHSAVRISSELERHLQWIQEDVELGFERVYLHNTGTNQRQFIEAFGEHVLSRITPGDISKARTEEISG